jgi:hypothetical protein
VSVVTCCIVPIMKRVELSPCLGPTVYPRGRALDIVTCSTLPALDATCVQTAMVSRTRSTNLGRAKRFDGTGRSDIETPSINAVGEKPSSLSHPHLMMPPMQGGFHEEVFVEASRNFSGSFREASGRLPGSSRVPGGFREASGRLPQEASSEASGRLPEARRLP